MARRPAQQRAPLQPARADGRQLPPPTDGLVAPSPPEQATVARAAVVPVRAKATSDAAGPEPASDEQPTAASSAPRSRRPVSRPTAPADAAQSDRYAQARKELHALRYLSPLWEAVEQRRDELNAQRLTGRQRTSCTELIEALLHRALFAAPLDPEALAAAVRELRGALAA